MRRNEFRRCLLCAAGVLILTACSTQPTATEKSPGIPSPENPEAHIEQKAEFGKWGVETQYISPAIKPGDDFYRHVNQGWLTGTEIPAGFPMVGSFVELMLRTEKQVNSIISDLEKQQAAAGTPAQQIADMHASYMNTAQRNALGSSMFQADVKSLLALKTRAEIARRMGRNGYGSITDMGVLPDSTNPQRYTLVIAQGGLGLPGRDYYLKKEEPYASLRQAYADYVAGVFTRASVPDAKSRAQAVLAFETRLAEKQWTPAQSREAVRGHHVMPVQELARYAPGFDWQAMLSEGGFGDVVSIDLKNDTALRDMAAVFAKTPIDTLRAYTIFHYLDNFAPYLSEEWEQANFDMYSRKLSGIAQQRPLDVRAVQFLNSTMGEQIGKLYVERHFPPESKASIDKLVKFLRLAFHQRLEEVEWMDEKTRQEALTKLEALTTKIGYPEQWHDYSKLVILKDDLVGNMLRTMEWQQKDARAKLDEPLRQWEWAMNPQVINAYYNPLGAELVFPAAILQAPFFDPKADPAVNFGAIGMVIGHEMGHAFDDQGSHYDGTGALRNWWSETSRSRFDQRTDKLAEQFSQYSPLPGLNVKGRLTLGENIGDLGGMMIAWTGYQNFVAQEYQEQKYQGKAPVIEGYTGNQRFFMGYAQLWRGLYKDDYLRQITLTDTHSPSEYRVNGVLTNFTPWYEAFTIKPDNKMYRPENERVRIW